MQRILIVEDEPMLAQVLDRTLGREYRVRITHDARTAMAALEEDAGYHAILCDVGLPELTGIDLYAMAQHRWPGIERRFIFVTGGFNSEPIQRFLDLVPNATIAKPYQITEIIEAVARLINNA